MNTEIINTFKKSFAGSIIQPHDADYDILRKVYNGMIDKRPAMIAMWTKSADVNTIPKIYLG